MSNTKKTAMAVKIQFSSDKYKLSELKFLACHTVNTVTGISFYVFDSI